MRFNNLPLKTKVLIGGLTPLALLILIAGVTLFNINAMVDSNKWVEHTHKVLGQAKNIIGSAVDMETGMRGYLLAGKEEFLAPYQGGEKATYAAIESLQHTVSDNPGQVARLGEVQDVLKAWQENVTEPTIALRRNIGDAETMNDMAKLVGDAKGKAYFDKFRAQIAEFISREETLMKERQAAANEAIGKNEELAHQVTVNNNWVTHTNKVIAVANNIIAAGVNMETGLRGFLLAGKEEFLEPYNNGREQFSHLVSTLSETVSDNPSQVELLAEIDTTIGEWMANVTEPMIRLRRTVDTGGATMDRIAAEVAKAQGKTYFDKFRGQVALFIEREEALMVQRREDVATATEAAKANRQLMADTTGWVTHTQNVIEKANEIVAAAVNMETGMRGYLLAGKEDFLDPYTNGLARFNERVAALSETVSDNPAQVALLGEVKSTIDSWQKDVTEPQIALRRNIGDAKTMDDMADLIGEAKGKTYFDKFRTLMADFSNEEQALMAQRQAANEARVGNTIKIVLGCSAAAILLGLLLSLGVTRSVMSQLGSDPAEIQDIANEIAGGNLAVQFDDRKDVGVYASMKHMSRNLSTMFEDINNGVQTLTTTSEGLSVVSEQMASGAGQTSAKSNNVSSSATEMASNMNSVAAATEQTSANIQMIVTAAEEMSATINEIARNTSKGSETTASAVKKAEYVSNKVDELGRAATEIGAVTETIADISEQTNLLALNATIEAARAGEAGKGFTVVAGEIKTLAQQTAEATAEIKRRIDGVQTTTNESVTAIKSIVEVINEIDSIVATVATAIEEQSATTGEISSNVSQAAEGVQEVNNNVNQTSAFVAEVTSDIGQVSEATDEIKTSGLSVKSSAADLAALAKDLNGMMSRFTLH
ncbi:MAG: CHASE3 domain-containing protein [Desulfobacterales bacterium]|nr:CHASE3 domain-containing protein [Desulfobacterales bacterium]